MSVSTLVGAGLLLALVFPGLVLIDWLMDRLSAWVRLRATGRVERDPWDELSEEDRAALRRWHRN